MVARCSRVRGWSRPEPSGCLVVSVTVPSGLVTVVVEEPSGRVVLSVLSPEEALPLPEEEEPPPVEPPPVEPLSSSSSSAGGVGVGFSLTVYGPRLLTS